MVQKKIPIRQCVGCREKKPKRELIRIVKSPEGTISVDFSGKANGRGAYLCCSTDCLKKAIKSRTLERAFEVSISSEIFERLEREIGQYYAE